MRVAHFVQRYPPALGGSEAYFARLGRHLAAAGDVVTVFTTTAVDLEGFWTTRGRCVRPTAAGLPAARPPGDAPGRRPRLRTDRGRAGRPAGPRPCRGARGAAGDGGGRRGLHRRRPGAGAGGVGRWDRGGGGRTPGEQQPGE